MHRFPSPGNPRCIGFSRPENLGTSISYTPNISDLSKTITKSLITSFGWVGPFPDCPSGSISVAKVKGPGKHIGQIFQRSMSFGISNPGSLSYSTPSITTPHCSQWNSRGQSVQDSFIHDIPWYCNSRSVLNPLKPREGLQLSFFPKPVLRKL